MSVAKDEKRYPLSDKLPFKIAPFTDMNITDSVIVEFDNKRTPFEMYELQMELQRCLWTPSLTTDEQAQLKIELAAFSFGADFKGQNSLGTFFVPITQGNPDIAQIDSSYIAAWGTHCELHLEPCADARPTSVSRR